MPSGLDFEATGDSVICYFVFASRASSHSEHDLGALSWLNTEQSNTAKND